MAPTTAKKASKRLKSSSKQAVNISRDRDPSIENNNKRKPSIRKDLVTPSKNARPFGSNRKSLKDLRHKEDKFQITESKKKVSIRKERVNSQQSV